MAKLSKVRRKQVRAVSKAAKKSGKPLLDIAADGGAATASSVDRRDIETQDISLTLPADISRDKMGRYKLELSQITTDIMEAISRHLASVEDPKLKLKALATEKANAACDHSAASGEKIAGIMDQMERVTGDLEEMTKQHRADVAKMEARSKKLASMIRSGKDYAKVDCTVTRNFLSKQLQIQRIDTGEVVEERALSLDELQQALPEGD